MIVQFLLDQNDTKYYPTSLKGRYRARLCSFVYRDSAGNGQNFLIKVSSSCFRTESAAFGGDSLLFSNHIDHGTPFSAPEFIIDVNGAMDLTLSMAAGTGIGTLTYAVLTLDVEHLD